MKEKLLHLQVARGVAANLVVLQHLWQFELRYAGTELPYAVHYGDLGVDIFFVLSGFVMVAVAGRGVGPIHFLWRRAARIYPTYWLATAVMLGVAIALPGVVHESMDQIPLWRSFLLIPPAKPQVVSVGWSLVHEMYFYVVFAILLALRVPILLGVLAWATIIIGAAVAWPDYVAASPVLSTLASPLTFEFMMGMIIGTLWLHTRALGSVAVGAIGLALFVVSIWVQHFLLPQPSEALPFGSTPFFDTMRVLLFGIPIALMVYALVAYERRSSSRPPALLVAIGDWSYSIYLFHFMVLSVLGRAVFRLFGDHRISASIVLLVAGFVLVNFIGWLLYTLFERPTLISLHRIGPSTQKASASAEPRGADQKRNWIPESINVRATARD